MSQTQDIMTALCAEQLAVKDLYNALMDIGVGLLGGNMTADQALQARYDAYLTFTKVVEKNKHLTQESQESAS